MSRNARHLEPLPEHTHVADDRECRRSAQLVLQLIRVQLSPGLSHRHIVEFDRRQVRLEHVSLRVERFRRPHELDQESLCAFDKSVVLRPVAELQAGPRSAREVRRGHPEPVRRESDDFFDVPKRSLVVPPEMSEQRELGVNDRSERFPATEAERSNRGYHRVVHPSVRSNDRRLAVDLRCGLDAPHPHPSVAVAFERITRERGAKEVC
jgi:hypothetical protein